MTQDEIKVELEQLKNALYYEQVYAYPIDMEFVHYLEKRIKYLKSLKDNSQCKP